MDEPQYRELCLKCRRPKSVCWCGAVKAMPSQTHVVFLQHPRESRVPISTCRMAHLSLPNSEMHVGLNAEHSARLTQVAKEPGTAVLFPSDEAIDVSELDAPPKNLVVVDGTWSTARKVVERSPLLKALPRISLNPDRPGNYRIRKEPKPNCLSTIEAVALVLGHLEGQPLKFQPILSAFDRMVETQIGHIGEGPSRHRRFHERNGPKRDFVAPLRDAWPDLVIAYGEANGWPADSGVTGLAEMVQLVALKPSTGERFEVVLAPRRPLAPGVPLHLGISPEELANGLTPRDAMERWRAFSKHAVIATWGAYTLHLLAAEGEKPERTLNLKHIASQRIYASTGGIEKHSAELGFSVDFDAGRGRRRLDALSHIVSRLVANSSAQAHLSAQSVH